MDLYIYHGRLDPNSGPTTVEGEPIDDWGFEGPRLTRCVGIHVTYGNLNVFFEDNDARDAAIEQTGWPVWDENALSLQMQDGCLKLWNKERGRWEYFGDWGVI